VDGIVNSDAILMKLARRDRMKKLMLIAVIAVAGYTHLITTRYPTSPANVDVLSQQPSNSDQNSPVLTKTGQVSFNCVAAVRLSAVTG